MKLIFLITGLLLCSCVTSRSAPLPVAHIGVGSTLVSVGLYFALAGSIAVGAGLLGALACVFFGAIAIFRAYLIELAVLGFGAILLGSSFIWLGNHAWLLAVVVGLLAFLTAYRYRAFVVSFFQNSEVAPPLIAAIPSASKV